MWFNCRIGDGYNGEQQQLVMDTLLFIVQWARQSSENVKIMGEDDNLRRQRYLAVVEEFSALYEAF